MSAGGEGVVGGHGVEYYYLRMTGGTVDGWRLSSCRVSIRHGK